MCVFKKKRVYQANVFFIIIISDYCNNINHLFLACQVLLGSHNRFVYQTQTSIHNQEHTQSIYIYGSYNQSKGRRPCMCKSPSLSTHARARARARTRVHAPLRPLLTHSIYLYNMPWPHHSRSTEQQEVPGWFCPSLVACLSVPPSISLPNMFNAQNRKGFHSKSSSAVHNHRSAASYSTALIQCRTSFYYGMFFIGTVLFTCLIFHIL